MLMRDVSAIMIVDDNEPMRILIRNILENEGYKNVFEAEDGVSACEILKEHKIDLIISDWKMPGMTGLELLTKVRSNQPIAQIPFIMVSVEGLDVTVDQAFKNGANDFVSKPFTVDDLVLSVNRLIKQTN
jgi:two-component system, chemotaxis family, chemotaxis protein CheY